MSEGRGKVRRQMTSWMHEKTKAEWAEEAAKNQIEIERLQAALKEKERFWTLEVTELRIQRDYLRAALRRIADSPDSKSILVLPEGDTVWRFAKEALGD